MESCLLCKINGMVALKLNDNPFRAGPGTVPLHIAGRAEERALINETLVKIAELPKGKKRDQSLGPLAPIKIVGPRGVGKTTLLKEARKMANELGIHITHVAKLNSLAEESMLVDLVGNTAHEKIAAKLARVKSLSAGPAGISFDQEQLSLLEHLRKRMKQKPLLLLLDEAMHYERSALGGLLQLCQKLIIENEPLAVIMAGTPQLDQFLGQVDATFINRSESLRINILGDEDTRDALAKPFAMLDIKAAPAAIDYMAALTDNYPFFIQIAGSQVWKTMVKTGNREVSLALVQKSQAEIEKRREDFYYGIYAEISNAGLMRPALRIVEILEMNDGKAGRETLLSGLAGKQRGVYGKEQRKAFAQLVNLGFIWEEDSGVRAGIPSFFSYCKQKDKQGQSEKF